MNEISQTAPHWKIIVAAILDFLTAFVVCGYLVAWGLGQDTRSGFHLTGFPAIVTLAMIVVYFVAGNRSGGTLWKRILGVPVRN